MAALPTPSAHVVGNAFVHQYYHILHQSPELVYRFYQERSTLGRPEADSTMSSVTTMDAINQKILSLDYSRHRAEIRSVDAQDSLDGGVLVLVTGHLTKPDGPKRIFSQSFFLAPQEKGFYVLNDIFRYMEEPVSQVVEPSPPNGAVAADSPENDASLIQEQQVPEHNGPVEEERGEDPAVAEVYNPSDNDDGSVVDEEVPVPEVVDEAPNSANFTVVVESSNAVQEEAPKKSYASIVKVMKENMAPLAAPPISAKSPSVAKVAAVVSQRQSNPASVPASSPEVASSAHINDGSGQDETADGYSIYVRSLPFNATVAQLEEEFKKFGPIKSDGIQVRSHKQQGFCFGFVEFEVASAVQSAIEASPIMIGGRQAYVEVKRTTGSRVGGRGRFIPGRGDGFRSDGMRGRGSYGPGRGYGRVDYGNADFGRGRRAGSTNRVDMGYQRVDSGGRGGRSASEVAYKNATNRVSAPA